MITNSLDCKTYDKFRIKLVSDKDWIIVTSEDKEKILNALNGGAKYISLGNIFFAVSSLSSILPLNAVGEIVLEPNKRMSLPERASYSGKPERVVSKETLKKFNSKRKELGL